MRVAILHYQPLEYYPPIMNTLNFIGDTSDLTVNVYTSRNSKRGRFSHQQIKVRRFPLPNYNDSKFVSLVKQLLYNIGTLFSLIVLRPNVLLYYESYSALPAYLYARFINKNVKLLIHFHEYSAPEWYINGMKLVKFYHKFERKFLFKKASWISQTNAERVKLFYQDFPFINQNVLHELPNYPPQKWELNSTKRDMISKPLKIVYVGSLSLSSTYIKEFCEWVLSKQGDVKFDIYCYNIEKGTKDYINSISNTNIKLYSSGIDYDFIPDVISKYDIGVILYKIYNANVKYSASNKLFEYLSCDLDVWFSDAILGTHPYIVKDAYPKVLNVDFNSLVNFDLEKAICRKSLNRRSLKFNAEDVNKLLLQELDS
ncbi:hypothetical protein GCM10027443_13920 [Pontibacter brevis]